MSQYNAQEWIESLGAAYAQAEDETYELADMCMNEADARWAKGAEVERLQDQLLRAVARASVAEGRAAVAEAGFAAVEPALTQAKSEIQYLSAQLSTAITKLVDADVKADKWFGFAAVAAVLATIGWVAFVVQVLR